MSMCTISAKTALGGHGFETVIVPLRDDAYRTALRLSRDADEARDLTQEALLRALKGFKRFAPGTNARAWLRTIVRSVFLNRCRQRQRDRLVFVDDVEEVSSSRHAPPKGESSPGSAAAWPMSASMLAPDLSVGGARRIVDADIRWALRRLPARFRTAVCLIDLEERTYEDAASVLGCPVNTLKSRLFRGRRRLAADLRPVAG